MIDTIELDSVFRGCLFEEEEDATDRVEVQGILNRFGFHPDRLEQSRPKIVAWLAELPDQFHVGKGGGWSFLNACMTRDGKQWGEHRSMDQLFSLGQGLGLVKCQMPRSIWASLPGGMPYYAIDLTQEATDA